MSSRGELTRIDEQFQAALDGPAWHGPSVLEVLEGVTASDAAAHPIPGAHSIWELVLHLAGTHGLVLRRIGGDPRPLSADEDWPVAPSPSEAHWHAAIEALRAAHAATRGAVREFDVARLDRRLVETPEYSAYVQFIGLTQHDLYHAGQIALLKRALMRATSSG